MKSLDPARCAELISASSSIVALTGAGISTAAGIPDFRGPQGLYVTRRYDPEKVFEIDWFSKAPDYFYEFSRDFTETVKNIKPTLTHLFLARLESAGLLSTVITQNIDLLHQAAGSKNIIELHGSYSSATCQSCRARQSKLDYHWWSEQMLASRRAPVVLCAKCNGVIKPDIVFFGEPVTAFEKAEKAVEDCDLLLVMGTSLNVAPASLLPAYSSAITIIVNKGSVALSPSSKRYFINDFMDNYFIQVSSHLGFDQAGSPRRAT